MRKLYKIKKRRYFGKNRSKAKKGENQKVRNAKRHLIEGINFRSGLEVFCYQELKKAKLDFEYEERTFVLQDGFEYTLPTMETKMVKNKITGRMSKVYAKTESHKIRPLSYNPDFVYITENKTGWVIEVKGYASPEYLIKLKLFKKYLINNKYKIYFFLPSTQSQVLESIEKLKILKLQHKW